MVDYFLLARIMSLSVGNTQSSESAAGQILPHDGSTELAFPAYLPHILLSIPKKDREFRRPVQGHTPCSTETMYYRVVMARKVEGPTCRLWKSGSPRSKPK